jgi:hypothetical protein
VHRAQRRLQPHGLQVGLRLGGWRPASAVCRAVPGRRAGGELAGVAQARLGWQPSRRRRRGCCLTSAARSPPPAQGVQAGVLLDLRERLAAAWQGHGRLLPLLALAAAAGRARRRQPAAGHAHGRRPGRRRPGRRAAGRAAQQREACCARVQEPEVRRLLRAPRPGAGAARLGSAAVSCAACTGAPGAARQPPGAAAPAPATSRPRWGADRACGRTCRPRYARCYAAHQLGPARLQQLAAHMRLLLEAGAGGDRAAGPPEALAQLLSSAQALLPGAKSALRHSYVLAYYLEDMPGRCGAVWCAGCVGPCAPCARARQGDVQALSATCCPRAEPLPPAPHPPLLQEVPGGLAGERLLGLALGGGGGDAAGPCRGAAGALGGSRPWLPGQRLRTHPGQWVCCTVRQASHGSPR